LLRLRILSSQIQSIGNRGDTLWLRPTAALRICMKTPPVSRFFPSLQVGLKVVAVASLLLSVQACAVVAVADAAVTVVATGVKVTAKTVGAVAAAAIPD